MSQAVKDASVSRQKAARVSPFYWAVRREIWEHRFIYIAPLAVAALVLVSFAAGTWQLPHIMQTHQTTCKPGPCAPPPDGMPYMAAAGAVLLTGILVGVIYALGALYNERRDRSILFWKSLPVSDLLTVLAKASIPLAVIPALVFLITMVLELAMMATAALIVSIHGTALPPFWQAWPVLRLTVVLFYALATLTLWHAPLYGWMLMVSAWAKRAPFLWAFLPPLALSLAEKIAFGTSVFGQMLAVRELGAFDLAFRVKQQDALPVRWDQLAPLQFLSAPELWSGLAVTIVFLGVAGRLRRGRAAL